MEDIRATLNERRKTHGHYASTARVSQGAKALLHDGDTWHDMTDAEREAADMIVHKLARAVNGDSHELDHWRDIIGYAQLVLDELMQVAPKQEG